MATIRLRRINDDGCKVYLIRAYKERGHGEKSLTWVAPAGWSQKSIDRELNRLAAELERKIKSGEILTRIEQKEKARVDAEEATKIKTVRQYGDGVYIPSKRGECAIRTLEYYKSTLERYIYPAIGDKKVVDVRTVDLKQIIVAAQNKGLSHSTIRGIYLTMAQLFDQATNDDMVEANPMNKVKAPRRNKEETKSEIEIYTDDELATIRECLNLEPLKWRTFFNLLMDTGIRKGEACVIKWSNINFANDSVKIDGTAVNAPREDGKGVKVVATKPKNGKSRTVFPSVETMQLLRDMREESGQYDYVFVQTNMTVDHKSVNEPLSPQSADSYLRKFVKKYELTFKCHPHKFRHTVATKLLQNGVSLQDAARLIGDNPETVVRFYLHSNDDAVRQASEILHKAIGRSNNTLSFRTAVRTDSKKSVQKRRLTIVNDN